ncbi:hypothetical protein RCR19_30850 [Streptomyces sp. WAC07094]|nr:hypothetical protein [Streptomyces sp. WAC07094]
MAGHRFTPVPDPAYLARALVMAQHAFEACAVLTAMGLRLTQASERLR